MHTQNSHPPAAALITFVVPCYNLSAELLCACMDSILALPLAPEEREILVIDDGSDTPAEAHLQSYQKDIRIIRRPNGGLSRARNTGMDAATGEYIQFVDGDDALSPENYARCIALLREQQPDMLLFRFVGKESPTRRDARLVRPHRWNPKDIFDRRTKEEKASGLRTHEPCVPTSGCDVSQQPQTGTAYMLRHNLRASACLYLFLRSMAGRLRFLPDMLHEDEAFTPQLFLRARRVVDSGIGAYIYRHRPESITTRMDEAHISRRLADKEAVAVMLREMATHLPTEQAAALRRRVAQLTMDCLVDVFRLGQSASLWIRLSRCVSRLRARGLFPLPAEPYTLSYYLFARLSASRAGMWLLCRLVPLLYK